ncbi:histidinol-phosphatase [Cohnella sp. CIP 111063]|jgi:histidinol phosphate phosphatase HisJ family|uniref:histidinol-phosphatase HisJ family protein n=1 Tax=unclassified Cohnella TaxID=2636738 RepID=UPI000B8BE8A5|nr:MULTISPECIES: histidinol-phosphatase HisJ family protein [unclassified Cohnella]OXS53809.1 histidinol-phosphatase [Cohnella sp. CIP 111063]PRX62386.1 histidinol-phosphatase (PHP family) [Cohnella sp. SGD-V74]
MKVDFHFHLEEGPYSFNWLQRTAKALEVVPGEPEPRGDRNTLQWMEHQIERLKQRLDEGGFAERWMEAYLIEGRKKGIERFGMVDHLYRFEEFRGYYEKYILMDDSELGRLQRYWFDRVRMCSIEDFLGAARNMQAQGHPLSIGVEADYFPGGEAELKALLDRYELDYVIGSVHFLDGWGFDNPEVKEIYESKDLLELYKYSFEHVKQAADSGLFDMIAHLDNLKVFGYRPDESLLIDLYDDLAAALKRAGVATEINTGLAYRYPVKEMCPSPSLLAKLHEHGVPITLSSDSHYPDDIGTLLDEAAELAKRTGYTEIVYFENRKRLTLPL